jgi:transforming growth factor-beta-induced protein
VEREFSGSLVNALSRLRLTERFDRFCGNRSLLGTIQVTHISENDMLRRSVLGIVAAAIIALAHGQVMAQAAAAKDIVTTAVEAGSFKTLAAALTAAGLVDTLQGKGPFTVFAPSDEAFAKLPEGTVETLLKPENKAQLIAVLAYHVVPGKVLAADVVKLKSASTVNGQRVNIKVDGGKVFVDQAGVVATDIACSNGVIHVIDQVILPSSDNIPATADKAGTFKTLLAAAKAAGLVDVLAGDKPLTVFAPTDAAFAKLPAGTVESLLKPENKGKLAALLTFHVVPGRVFSGDVLASKGLKTVNGGVLVPAVVNGTATINGASIVAADIDASNGVIHVIDTVLLPPAAAPKTSLVAPAATSHVVSYYCPQSRRMVTYRVAAPVRH